MGENHNNLDKYAQSAFDTVTGKCYIKDPMFIYLYNIRTVS